jgi:uncharacterized protein HemY
LTRIERLQLFLEKEPADAFLNYALAMEYIGQESYEKALEILEKLESSQEDYTATYYHLAQLYLRFGKTADAERIFKKGLQLTAKAGEHHQRQELQNAYNAYLYDDE